MSEHHDRLLALLSYNQCFLTKDDANEIAAWIRSLLAEGKIIRSMRVKRDQDAEEIERLNGHCNKLAQQLASHQPIIDAARNLTRAQGKQIDQWWDILEQRLDNHDKAET
jgi:hypothetical protein